MSKHESEEPRKDEEKRPLPQVAAPEFAYRPRDPQQYRPGIALVGCGGIAAWHLKAYRSAGYNVVVLCDVDRTRAEQRRDKFYPNAAVTSDYRKVIDRDDVEVIDITTHPHERRLLIEAAILAGRHILSQKPFVTDLDVGLRLADLADAHDVRLAVNQNARWAPHFSYIREAVRAGVLGQIDAVLCDVHWDHSWVLGTRFESIRHLILYDYAIHWFDMLTVLLDGANATSIYATVTHSATQQVAPPLLAQVAVAYPASQATLVFDGHTRHGRFDRTLISGSRATIQSFGPSNDHQQVELITAAGIARPELTGQWFPDGFHGAMGELLSAIEENREPTHGARGNLASLALCFAAVASAERGEPVVPGSVRKLPEKAV